MKRQYTLKVNGCAIAVETEPRKTLADVLREECRLTGTHIGCEHGVCGACTILMDGALVRACLMFAVQAEGAELRTVESLAGADGSLNALQQSFHEHHALQCGFCTPGFLMLGTALLERVDPVSDEELDAVLSSNLCRCTGYGTIRRALRAALDARPTTT
jgi:aerobic carbon-monoxide dehydrogenase small subunit